ncbi:MAG: hypothetical protein OER86_11100, partial [Phycisphaerae bacterium]|nr:hypothetical protein [Phycisphaerae bacterium]
ERQQLLAEQRRLEQEHLQHEARREQAEQRRQFATSALGEAEGQLKQENDQHSELAERAEGLIRQLTEHQQVLDDLNRQALESDQQIETAQSAHRDRQHELNELQSRLEDEKAGIVNLLRRTTEAHNQINSLQMQEKNLQGHRDRLTSRADELATELAQFLGSRDLVSGQVTEAAGLIESEKLRLEEQKTAAGDLTDAHRRLAEKLSAAKEQRSARDSRRAVLQELEESQTGMDEAVRTLLARRASTGEFGFVRGMLAEMIRTDTEHAALVEAALGHDQQLLVVDRLADLQANEAELQSLGGRVSFIALDQLPPLRQDPDGATRLPRAADFVEYDPAVSRLVWYLLGRTLVTDDLSTARELRRRLPRGYRFITPGGQVLEADGRLVVGPPMESAGPGLISRRSELTELDTELEKLNQDIDADQTHLQRLSDRAAHVERTQQELRQAIYEASTLKVELGARLEQMLDSIQRISTEQPVIAGEVKQVHRQLTEAATERNGHEQDAEKLTADSEASRGRAESLQREIDEKQAQVDEAAEAVTAARVAAGKLTEQLAAARKQHGQIDLAGQEAERHRSQLATRIEDVQRRMVQLRTNHKQAEQEIQEAQTAAEQASEQLEGFESRLGEISTSLGRLAESVSEHRAEAERLDQQMHESQVSRRELEVRCDGLRERASEQLSLDLAEAYRDYQEQEIDWETVETEIEELKTRIGRLGNVNLDAIDELKELEGREEELGKQIQDVDHARRELEHLIRYLNEESSTRFQQTFEQIREHFAGSGGLFRKLFGGGRADLVLLPDENGDTDWLESGVDIIAKPPGKEPQSIRLLSGGERTMVAVALLMSIFRSRPSPFCILDEVDAALDEANVDRFTQVVRSFLDHSHFIIITHHKRTMQTADLLYGITMPIRGVSKQVTVKFDHVGQGGKLSAEVLAQARAEAATPPAAPPTSPKAAQLADLASQASPATIEAASPDE